MDRVRVDKWLWSVRIFKSRSLAANACKSNKVKTEEGPLKPASLIQIGDVLKVSKDGYNFTFKVLKLIDKRVSAALAAPCYEDLTPEEELHKYEDWFIGKSGTEFREKGEGRPTKKHRRLLDRFKKNRF
jgi:ribosome-associated heat shock protein Hsp15